jgi:hypothetical protein
LVIVLRLRDGNVLGFITAGNEFFAELEKAREKAGSA